MSKTIRLGNRLRYPITIVKLLKQPGDVVKAQEPLMQYSFKWTKTVGDSIRGETWEEEQTSIVTWDSPSDGDLKQWLIREGQRIDKDAPCFIVKEACSHEIQFQGLCAICGKDMTEVNWAAEERDTARAPITMTHDLTNLTVSADQALRTESDLQKRLLQSRKLSLVVDLDQTIVHACIDPTVGEWQKDPTNPNYESVKNVKAFQLDDGPLGITRSCWYYIKMRPGLEGFLKRIADLYELHVYTMGTRAYAQSVARIVDPDQKLFGNRVISRDENGNMLAKSLQRLFPVSTNMVVIIDDRADVWPRNRHNLIKVAPYDFFRGIGDINSSFLPKRKDILPTAAAKEEPAVNGSGGPAKAKAPEKALDEFAEDMPVTQAQLEEQERTLEKQMKDRPLQLLQELQDREDEEAAERATVHSEDGDETRSSSPPPQRHQVLRDDDTELEFLEQHLTQLHKTYFTEYDRQQSHNGAATVDATTIPDVGPLLDTLKSRALRGLKVVLTGIIPNEISVERSEIGQQLLSFGATILNRVSRNTTHVVVNPQRLLTEKLKQALRIPTIKIVNPEWLAACFSQWAIVDETPYLVHVDVTNWPGRRAACDSEVEETDDTTKGKRGGKILRLKATAKAANTSGEAQELDDDSDDEGDSDDQDDEEEEMALMPDDLADGQLSPVDGLKTFNWGSADAELDEFLAEGSDDEDEDDGETQDTEGVTDADEPTPSRKRKFDGEEETEGEGGTDSERGSQGENAPPRPRSGQSKKLRRTQSVRGTSSLRNQYVSDADGDGDRDSSLPTPQGTGDEEDIKGDVELKDLDEADPDLEAELEAELMAEFEAAPAVEVGGEQEQEKG
ncbi:putative RNA polymerase II subunit A C-terminal domain phosphatase [Podospora aff. communis PSN243]|uniref:RNA polymerase II subunit A C-terminal domain phosphatase n=1 Tax=Podospora aff. communis PSN243 TaxID=3040156 RepID=A0AAV9G4G7_9PEZI|nr:putative RNA polymerase II subunit A C-terminal domain phosphatase [Podospora aff. communis PSN243]